VRAPVDTIAAPLFPTALPWVNTSGAQASILQRGKPMLVEFWDFCRPNSLRTLPYVKAWHERYAEEGLRVIGVHCPGFESSRDEQAVRDAVVRLGIVHPVLIDSELELWREYDNRGWPARYLFDGRARLFEYHYGEGAYQETELAIQELLGVAREPLEPLRAEDEPGARLVAQTEDQPGAWSGSYEAGGVWAVLGGSGTVTFSVGESGAASASAERDAGTGVEPTNGRKAVSDGNPSKTRTLSVEHPGAYPLVEHERHTTGTLDLEIGEGVVCHATCFTPGVM
jgi:thiol-disulfide isomerase/thioredoxin